jgi:sensor domain CHASE-containing protein
MQKERKLSAKTTKIIQRITVMIAQLNKDNQNTKIKTQIKTLINTIKSEVIMEIRILVTDIKNLTLNLML